MTDGSTRSQWRDSEEYCILKARGKQKSTLRLEKQPASLKVEIYLSPLKPVTVSCEEA
jgi:hypothetical protein